ncbi:MAG TPA: beta-ketoacyl-[acyl-carrier-protein] synthase family protein [Chitinispirillaceae bacterium]|nr:beta-ketoacyl-[acyl-carrier-protein] synthase family protein [Chitinispirillaceae bacterium]
MSNNHCTVAISGMGIICAIGNNCNEVRSALRTGKDGAGLVTRFDTSMFSAHYAAMIPDEDWKTIGRAAPQLDNRTALALVAAREALDDAHIDKKEYATMGLVYGVCVGGKHGTDESEDQELLRNRLQNQAASLAATLSINGPSFVTSTACASSAQAIGLATYLLRMCMLDTVLVGGAGDVAPEMYAGFHALGVMSPEPCAPYSVPFGLNLGEGAAFFVLKRKDDIDSEKEKIHGYIAGYGSALDAFHATTPESSGAGVASAFTHALIDAKLDVQSIGYINTHGTGTNENDKSEWLGIKSVLKDYYTSIPVSSSKSFLGHTGGAAGIVEAALTVLSMEEQFIPPTIHCKQKRRLAPPDIVNEPGARLHTYSYAASCNAAFGGVNTSVLLGSNKTPHRIHKSVFQAIVIQGFGLIVPSQVQPLSIEKPISKESSKLCICEDLSKFTKGRDERYLDPVSRYLTAACHNALTDAGLTVDESVATKRGLFTGAAHIPSSSLDEFEASQKNRGLENLSPHAFARIVMNAATGAAAELLRIKGPSMTVASGDGAGLAALVAACCELTFRDDLDCCIVGAADELGDLPLKLHKIAGRESVPSEAASALILSKREIKPGDVVISGIGIAGPDALDKAITNALVHCNGNVSLVLDTSDLSSQSQSIINNGLKNFFGKSGMPSIVQCAKYWGFAESSTSLCATVYAYSQLTSSQQWEKILVITASAMNYSIAVLIERR